KAHYADGETERARQNAKRMAFGRAIEAAREKGRIVTRELSAVEYIWLARAADEAQATTVRIAGRKPADDPAPAQTLDGSASVASVAAFLSNSVKEQLRGFGCTEEYILHVLPEDAHAFLAQRRKLAGVLAAWLAAIGAGQRHTAEQVIAAADAAVADDDEAGDKLKLTLTAAAGPDHLDTSRLEAGLHSISGGQGAPLSLRSDGPDENGAPLWTLKLRVEPDQGSGSV